MLIICHVWTVKASDVEKIILQHSNDRIHPSTFCVRPRDYSFTARMLKPTRELRTKDSKREPLKMKASQVPLLINNATTGRKLQGSGVEKLFVHNWSNVTNWVYILLSRVKTRGGLYCRKKLTAKPKSFDIPKELTRMLNAFQPLKSTVWSEENYQWLLQLTSTEDVH